MASSGGGHLALLVRGCGDHVRLMSGAHCGPRTWGPSGSLRLDSWCSALDSLPSPTILIPSPLAMLPRLLGCSPCNTAQYLVADSLRAADPGQVFRHVLALTLVLFIADATKNLGPPLLALLWLFYVGLDGGAAGLPLTSRARRAALVSPGLHWSGQACWWLVVQRSARPSRQSYNEPMAANGCCRRREWRPIISRNITR